MASHSLLTTKICSAFPELVLPGFGMTFKASTDIKTCIAVADAQQASPSSHLCHDADQPGVIERGGGKLSSAAPVVDRASEGSTSVSADADGLMRQQGSTAWSDNTENINAGMLLAPNHVPKQANSILMGSCSGSLSAL